MCAQPPAPPRHRAGVRAATAAASREQDRPTCVLSAVRLKSVAAIDLSQASRKGKAFACLIVHHPRTVDIPGAVDLRREWASFIKPASTVLRAAQIANSLQQR